MPARVEQMLGLWDGARAALRVWPVPEILAIFWPYRAEQIDFDVDLRELQGQERLDAMCVFLRCIGRRLGKPVVMTAEGGAVDPLLGYDVEAGRVVLIPHD
jgi:hypothetical protein